MALMAAIQTVTMTLCRALQSANKDNASGSIQEQIRCAEELASIVKGTYTPILHGLELLRPDTDEEGQVVFHAIPDVSDVARREDGVSLRPRAQGFKADMDRGGPVIATEEESGCKIITKTLIKMILLLNLSRDAHCEVLEGILCALLDHIGSVLSLLVFSDSSGKAEGVVGILPPTGLIDAAHEDLESAVESAKLEGPYLICILRKAMEFLQSNTNSMSERGLLLFSPRKATGDRNLRQSIEETLQNTLLRGVFGDDDDTFHNSLRRREINVEPDLNKLMQEITPDATSSEWFIGQLWEHLEWSILSGRRAR
nr:hypothetical protein LTR18_002783 [Exophiala xenobiotica]